MGYETREAVQYCLVVMALDHDLTSVVPAPLPPHIRKLSGREYPREECACKIYRRVGSKEIENPKVWRQWGEWGAEPEAETIAKSKMLPRGWPP